MSAYSGNRRKEFLLLTAAALAPALGWAFVPVFSIIALLITPVPLALLVRRLDLRYGMGAVLITMAVITAFTGKPYLALIMAMQTGPMGLYLGLLFKNHVSFGRALASTAALSVVVSLAVFLSGYLVTGESPLVLSENQREVFNQERELLNKMFGEEISAGAANPAAVKEFEAVISRVEALWPVLAITSVAVWFMASACATLLLTRAVMARLGHPVPAAIPFTMWRLPWYVIWGVIAGLAMLLGGDMYRSAGLSVAGKSMLWVMGFVLSVNGASVALFYLRRWNAARPFKLLAVIIMVIYLPLTAAVLTSAGVIDAVWNVRRLGPGGASPKEEDKK